MKIEKEELKKLYHSNSNRSVCDKLKISNPTLIKTLIKAGIKLKGKGDRTPKSKIVVY